MSRVDRIRRERGLEAMVALDTIDLLADRVINLLSHGRRITLVQRFTYTQQPPTVATGLSLRDEPKVRHQDGGASFGVHLEPGVLTGFGFRAYACDGNDTEANAWQRYRTGKAESDRRSERRQDMTHLWIVGGLSNDSPARDDLLVIRHWNHDGVCTETVVAFDTGLLFEQSGARR